MNAAASEMHSDTQQAEMRTCPMCQVLFQPETPWQTFCCPTHRNAYDREYGALGVVASVRKLRKGVSVVLHLEGPAAERALKLTPRELVRLVKKP